MKMRETIAYIFLVIIVAVFYVWWEIDPGEHINPGCGSTGAAAYLYGNYSVIDIRDSRYTDEVAYVFEMPQSVSKEAAKLAEEFKPVAMTQEQNDDRMILVYTENVVDIYSEDQKTYAEVVSKGYVRDHYDSGGFFKGYLTATVIRDIFDGPKSYTYETQEPFTSRKAVSDYGKSLRQGSVGSKKVTGGGLSGGK